MPRDLQSKDVAWYRFTTTSGKVYGPRDMAFVWKTYGSDSTCEVATAGPDGQPVEPWFPATTLRARLVNQAVQPRQLARLRELGVSFNDETIDKIEATALIREAEQELPATPEELEEARTLGVAVTPGMSRAAVQALIEPVIAANEDEAERRERIAMNAKTVRWIRKAGLTVADDADDDQLDELRDVVDAFNDAVTEARERGLPASKVPKVTTTDAMQTATQRLERWATVADRLDGDLLEFRLKLSKAPPQKVVNEVRVALFEAMQDDTALVSDSAAENWFLANAATQLGFTKRATASAPRTPAPPKRRDRTWVAAVGVVVVLPFLMRVCS